MGLSAATVHPVRKKGALPAFKAPGKGRAGRKAALADWLGICATTQAPRHSQPIRQPPPDYQSFRGPGAFKGPDKAIVSSGAGISPSAHLCRRPGSLTGGFTGSACCASCLSRTKISSKVELEMFGIGKHAHRAVRRDSAEKDKATSGRMAEIRLHTAILYPHRHHAHGITRGIWYLHFPFPFPVERSNRGQFSIPAVTGRVLPNGLGRAC